MTQLNIHPIQCSCGNIVDVEIYQSVNVTVDPELLGKVKNRSINCYACPKCGEKSELAHQFLFVDMDKKLWIWCYPEGMRGERLVIEKVHANDGSFNLLSKYTGQLPDLVFGYDELLKKIEQ